MTIWKYYIKNSEIDIFYTYSYHEAMAYLKELSMRYDVPPEDILISEYIENK